METYNFPIHTYIFTQALTNGACSFHLLSFLKTYKTKCLENKAKQNKTKIKTKLKKNTLKYMMCSCAWAFYN